MFDMEELEKAESEFVPTREEALRKKNTGNLCFQRGEHETAVELFSEAIALDQNDATFFSNRAAALLALGRGAEALRDAEEAVKMRPTWDKAHFRLGKAASLLGRWVRAVAAFETALGMLAPGDPASDEIERALRAARRKAATASRSASTVAATVTSTSSATAPGTAATAMARCEGAAHNEASRSGTRSQRPGQAATPEAVDIEDAAWTVVQAKPSDGAAGLQRLLADAPLRAKRPLAEMGTYRPPNEGRSLLVRVTRGCQWNKCTFCRMYRHMEFSMRPVEDVLEDIDVLHRIACVLGEARASGRDPMQAAHALLARGCSEENISQVWLFLDSGADTAFLQDADAMHANAADLARIVRHMRLRFPSVKRVTTYSRSDSIHSKSVEDLTDIRKAGLDRLHVGFESGAKRVIALCKKGVRAEEQVTAGQKAMQAGFEVSWYMMPGLGGRALSNEHAVESARAVNLARPNFVRLRSYGPVPGTPGMEQVLSGKVVLNSEEENVREIRTFVEHLDGDLETIVTSADHQNNLVAFEGRICDQRDQILQSIDKFLEMSEEQKEWYIVGRRAALFQGFDDFKATPSVKRRTFELKEQYGSLGDAFFRFLQRDSGS